MKRSTPLRRTGPPSRKTELRRETPIAPRNAKRKARRYATQFGAHADFIRSLPCDLCGARPPSDPHHARTRGAGGTARHLIPTCRTCHTEIHAGHGPARETLMRRAASYWTRSPHNED